MERFIIMKLPFPKKIDFGPFDEVACIVHCTLNFKVYSEQCALYTVQIEEKPSILYTNIDYYIFS